MNNQETPVNISHRLNAPFRYDEYGINYEGQPYIGVQSMVDRLNDVLGPLNWTHDHFDVREDMEEFSCEVLGSLSVFNESRNEWVTRKQYGNDTMTINRGETEPKAQSRMDAKKSAVSDSLKKCAAWFGTGADVFKGFVSAVKSNTTDYWNLIKEFDFLDKDGKQKNGIIILPDEYKEHYEAKGWIGVFESDLAKVRGKQPGAGSPESGGQQTNSGRGSRDSNKKETPPADTTNNTGAAATTTSNAPALIRCKATSNVVFNQDGTSTFSAILENKKDVKVFVPKELKRLVEKVHDGAILKVTGWLKEDKGQVNLAKTSKIEIENAGGQHQASA